MIEGSELFIRMFDKNPPLNISFFGRKNYFGEELLLVLSSFSTNKLAGF